MTTNSIEQYNKYRISNGSPPIASPDKYKRPRSLRMGDRTWEGLRDLAHSLGYTYAGQGNITALLESLGSNLWELNPKVDNEPVSEG